MRCLTCQRENREGARFCIGCGQALTVVCSACGMQLPPAAVFCDHCGAALKDQRTTPLPASPAPAHTAHDHASTAPVGHRLAAAERRQLTVLFCDLENFTYLSSQLDPEELRDILRTYQDTCATVVARFEGHIAQYLGDGLLVYFGYPVAHEDDVQRAVRAGLGMVEAIDRVNPRLQQEQGIGLTIRVGIHTGLVVVGELGSGSAREQLALGQTPNVAARLQGLAPPNTVMISAATHQLIAGYFKCQELGLQELKGVAQPMAVYQVQHESMARSRLDVAAATGLTPLVGRQTEFERLLAAWQQANAGAGQVVLLCGEPGIGKSSLVRA